MEPAFRISGSGVITVTVTGLTAGQAAAVQKSVRSSSGAGIEPAPFFSGTERRPAADAPAGVVLTGTAGALRRAAQLITSAAAAPPAPGRDLDSLLDNYLRSDYKIECGGTVLDLGSRTCIMGILNVTPDSFSDGGRFDALDRALAHARAMAEAGADIIDIGGESTRPGAEPVPEEEELRRIIPLFERLSAELPLPLSVDTYKASVARKALAAGASIVNDISGLRFSPDMARVAADHGAAVVVMHIKGTPRSMQQNPVYDDVIGEIRDYLEEGIAIALKGGVDPEKIIIDPGIGFGKNLEHNLTILGRLDEFKCLGRPILLGTSRKKFIGTVLDVPVPAERVDGTAATVAFGIIKGARIVRVHDVPQMARVARMTDAIVKSAQSAE